MITLKDRKALVYDFSRIFVTKQELQEVREELVMFRADINNLINVVDAALKKMLIHEQEMAAMGFPVQLHDTWIKKQDSAFE